MLKRIVQPLLSWYSVNRRELPWRENRDPYRIWISEIMLQQTRVDTVIPYYKRFLEELPDVFSLSSVPEDRLNKLWEGLGYYSRAANLKKAAEKITRDFNGKLPCSRDELLSLPGIGAYTAGAILSIAFGQAEPAVDGNVLRVLTRITDSDRNISEPETKQFFSDELKKVYPAGKASEFTQSLMELGALVCLPNGKPLCMICPLRDQCRALWKNTVEQRPVKAPPKKRRIEKMTAFLLYSADGFLALRRRTESGLLAGLYELPNLPGHLSLEEIRRRFPDCTAEKIPGHHAVFTHVEWDIHACKLTGSVCDPSLIWVKPEDLKRKYPLPSAFRPILNLKK